MTRFLRDATRRIVNNEVDNDREWEQIQARRQDFQTLTGESIESLRKLLDVLGRDARSGDRLWQWAERLEQWREPTEPSKSTHIPPPVFPECGQWTSGR